MQSSDKPDDKEVVSWQKARELVNQKGEKGEWKQLRTWTSRTHATKALNVIGSELLARAKQSNPINQDDHGICRFRSLRLGTEPGVFTAKADRIYFGDLYTVSEISPAGTWIKVVNRAGVTGWIESQSHLEVSRGEYKILASLKRSTTLNFLVNLLGMPGSFNVAEKVGI